jgi:hypothetical protein
MQDEDAEQAEEGKTLRAVLIGLGETQRSRGSRHVAQMRSGS